MGFTIEDNDISLGAAESIEIDRSDHCVIRNNVIRNAGATFTTSKPALQVSGNNNRIEDNVMEYVLIGIRQDGGDGNLYRANVIDYAVTAGIVVDGGSDNTVELNTIRNCQGDALAVSDDAGTGNEIKDNVLADNRLDLCNEDGAEASVAGQVVDSFSTSCFQDY